MTEAMDAKAIGKTLRDLRGGRTLESVASDWGVTKQAVSMWENGLRIPSDPMKIAISRYYGKPIENIFYPKK